MPNYKALLVAMLALLSACAATARAEDRTITLESLLAEMIDRDAVARYPDPPYVCKHESSYDRRSKTPDDPAGWFANEDNMEGMHIPMKWEDHQGRRECVMMDVDGPGAVVRFWTGGKKPEGKVRFYLDGADAPAIEAPLYDLLAGKSWVPKPLAIENSGNAGNLYLPIPFAKHCRITYDEANPKDPAAAPPQRWFNIEYRLYPAGTKVKAFTMEEAVRLRDAIRNTAGELGDRLNCYRGTEGDVEIKELDAVLIEPGGGISVDLSPGPAAVEYLRMRISKKDDPPNADGKEDFLGVMPGDSFGQDLLRTTVVKMTFDGKETVWCPMGDFFGSGAGLNEMYSRYRTVWYCGLMESTWTMPYKSSARITIVNLGEEKIRASLGGNIKQWMWDSRSMHFHATWRQERGIPTRPYRDWNYVTIQGKGVYVGDTLALFNPVKDWWGEGDEHIWVDGESFPSHFGTGSEDYYGYAWGNPTLFQGPFCNQPRADGPGNMGHVTNTRTRSLDAIPFTKSLKMDIEIWHWADCKVNYAATTYWYALPGATCNVKPMPEEATAPIPASPGLERRKKIAGAIECEAMKIVAQSDGTKTSTQDVDALAEGPWSDGKQLFVQGQKAGDFIELKIPVAEAGPQKVTLYGTKSYDYGTLRFSINGKPAQKDYDAYSKTSMASGPVELGSFEPKDGQMVLRVEVVGANPEAKGTKAYFGLDCVVVSKP